MEYKRLLEEKMRQIYKLESFDFIGLALNDILSKDLQLTSVIGNRNEKYKKIVIRPSKGIGGLVVSSGRSMLIQAFPASISGKQTDYPIMLAEKLISAIAVPIFCQEQVSGVLLGGYRKPTLKLKQRLVHLEKSALEISEILMGISDEETKDENLI